MLDSRTGSRILYAASDGKLYAFNFENSLDPAAGLDGCDRQPRPLRWSVPGREESNFYVLDVCSSPDSRLKGRLIATVQTASPGNRNFELPRLWWLQANADFTAIVQAGPLCESDPRLEPDDTYRYPSLGSDALGRLSITYLMRKSDVDAKWKLCAFNPWISITGIRLSRSIPPRFAS